jgi:hypothetical protein
MAGVAGIGAGGELVAEGCEPAGGEWGEGVEWGVALAEGCDEEGGVDAAFDAESWWAGVAGEWDAGVSDGIEGVSDVGWGDDPGCVGSCVEWECAGGDGEVQACGGAGDAGGDGVGGGLWSGGGALGDQQ